MSRWLYRLVRSTSCHPAALSPRPDRTLRQAGAGDTGTLPSLLASPCLHAPSATLVCSQKCLAHPYATLMCGAVKACHTVTLSNRRKHQHLAGMVPLRQTHSLGEQYHDGYPACHLTGPMLMLCRSSPNVHFLWNACIALSKMILSGMFCQCFAVALDSTGLPAELGFVKLSPPPNAGSTIMTLEEGFAPNGYTRQPSGGDHPQVCRGSHCEVATEEVDWGACICTALTRAHLEKLHGMGGSARRHGFNSLPYRLNFEAGLSSGACRCQVWLLRIMLTAGLVPPCMQHGWPDYSGTQSFKSSYWMVSGICKGYLGRPPHSYH